MSAGPVTREALIEAAAVPLAIVKSHGMWDKLNDAERAVVAEAVVGQVELVLDTVLPKLIKAVDALDDGRIGEGIYTRNATDMREAVAALLRSLTEEQR